MRTKPEFAEPILLVLIRVGEKITLDSLLEEVYNDMSHLLTDLDHELLFNGKVPRWRNQALNMLDGLIENGYVESSGDIFKATDKARSYFSD